MPIVVPAVLFIKMNPESKLLTRNIWPTPLFFGSYPNYAEIAPDLIEFLLELKCRASKPIDSGVALGAKSRTGLFESNFNLFQEPHPALNSLKRFIGNSLKNGLADLHDGGIPREAMDVRCGEAWFHVTNDGGFHSTLR